MSLKSLIPNNDNLLGGGTSALNHDEHRGDTVVNDNYPRDEPQFVTVGQEKPSRRRHAGGKPRVNFNLTEALRLRSLGYGYRKIARRMNNVNRSTVRRRLMEHDARQQALSPKPVLASAPAPRLPVVPVAPPAPSTAQDSLRSDYRPDWASVPPSQGVHELEPKAAPVPKVDPVPLAPSVDVPPPEPYGLDTVPAGTKTFFLLNGANNATLARNCAQVAVGIERWHPSYASLPAFRHADRFWVVMNSDEDNRAFLMSIVGDIAIRERCAISEGDSSITDVRWTWVQQVCKGRLMMQRANPRVGEELWQPQFEVVYRFQPMPQPNHTRELEALLAPPPAPEKPSPGGSWGEPYGFAKYGGFGSNSH